MKLAYLVILVGLFFFLSDKQNDCLFAQNFDDTTPSRLVIIKGKATIINHPDLGETQASSETIIFQKIGCETCFIGANIDINGNYKVLVGDGKYKIIVRNPSSPEVDLLVPDQKRIVDTGSENSSNSIINLDIKIKLPK